MSSSSCHFLLFLPLTLEHMFVIISLSLPIERAFISWGDLMDYKDLIIGLLDKADGRCLKLIYCYIRALLGLD